MEIIPFKDLKKIPWKNGGGITREIAIASKANQLVWRLSCADVAKDGAFSDFAGLVRILTVVSDSGMTLTHADGVLDAEPWVPVRFDGALKLHSQLNSKPLTDINLIYDPTVCSGDVVTYTGPLQLVIEHPSADVLFLHVLSGSPVIGKETVSTGDTVFNMAPNTLLKLVDNDAVLEIHVAYLEPSNAIDLVIAHS